MGCIIINEIEFHSYFEKISHALYYFYLFSYLKSSILIIRHFKIMIKIRIFNMYFI